MLRLVWGYYVRIDHYTHWQVVIFPRRDHTHKMFSDFFGFTIDYFSRISWNTDRLVRITDPYLIQSCI